MKHIHNITTLLLAMTLALLLSACNTKTTQDENNTTGSSTPTTQTTEDTSDTGSGAVTGGATQNGGITASSSGTTTSNGGSSNTTGGSNNNATNGNTNTGSGSNNSTTGGDGNTGTGTESNSTQTDTNATTGGEETNTTTGSNDGNSSTETNTTNSTTDTMPPVITLNGEANITLEQNAVYTELGATALDGVDGNISVSISGTVDTSTIGEYILTYTATDSSGNSASVSRMVNVIKKSNQIKSLTLTSPKTHFVRVKFAGEYNVVVANAKVMATYADGETVEVTDKVRWKGRHGRVYINAGKIIFHEESNLTLKATYENIESNPLNFTLQNAEHTGAYLYAKIYNEISKKFPKRGAGIEIRLLKEPNEDVFLPLRLNSSDKVGFEKSNALTKTLHFKAGAGWDRPQAVTIIDKDVNNTQPYTLYTDAFESNDSTYEGIDPKDIVITPHTSIEFIEPPLRKRKGAIRGVTVKILLYAKSGDVKTFKLIDPPKGMRLKNAPMHTINEFNDMSRSAKTIVWDVPMDIEEKTYDITVEAVDTEGKKGRITFPIKVPKTKPIQTTLKNNELTVTDKNSPLFGMKMKGHSGEDISNMKLRSVDYGDVWRKKRVEDLKKYASFVVYDKPQNVDFDFPELFSFYKYIPGQLLNDNSAWDNINRGYMEDDNGKFTIPVHREYDNGGNKVYFIYQNKKKKK